ncbi:MAG: methyltransferase regulatory domain-containing protein [Rhodobacteraceae bacterium]|nr:methyltransferase regulatory domain-containing protein [Paracoccaceae bacterium]
MNGAPSTDGYFTDLPYLAHYIRELNPHVIRAALNFNSVPAPDTYKSFSYMELGFGAGLSLVVNAAANPHADFYGVDLMQKHVDDVRDVARAAGIENLRADAIGFAQLDDQDYPDFDFIVLHGVWSWINEQNRQRILGFIARKLKSTGVVYVSYNVMTGWAALLPFRHLLKIKHDRAAGSADQRIRDALQQAAELEKAGAKYFKGNPAASEKLKNSLTMAPAYLAHEYLNADWAPFAFESVAADMGDLGLAFGGSAESVFNIAPFNFTAAGQKLIAQANDLIEAETLKDVLLNQRFRRDVYVATGKYSTRNAMLADLKTTLFAGLVTPELYPQVSLQTALGIFKGKMPSHRALIDTLAEKPDALENLLTHPALASFTIEDVAGSLAFLLAARAVGTALPPDLQERARPACDRLNAWLLSNANDGAVSPVLASPVLGGGFELPLQDFLIMANRGPTAAERAFEGLKARGQSFLGGDGQSLSDSVAVENLKRRAEQFAKEPGSILKALGLARDVDVLKAQGQ